MAKRIIILEKIEGKRPSFRVAFWANVPATRQSFYADPLKVSAYKDASAAELTDLQSGTVVESVETFSADPPKSIAEVMAFLESRWQEFQNQVDANNPWLRYGSFWDGTTWTAQGVS